MEKLERFGWIPDDLYFKIITVMPIPCVDILVKHEDKYLITKRTQKPLQGKWYLPGSRLYKGETIQEAVIRIAFSELGIKAEFSKPICVYDAFYKDGYFSQESQTLTFVVEARALTTDIKLNPAHSDFKWISKPSNNLHKYVRIAINQAKGDL